MLNKQERMKKLNLAGVDTGKYFTVNLPDGLAKNSTITLSINENGEYAVVNANAIIKENDPILNQIIEDGYVRNTKLHRRFVMAQMFSALNYVSWDGKYTGYNECLKRNYGYDYTFKMMLEEIRVLSKLELKDKESFYERVHFFDKSVVVAVMEDYMEKLKEHIDKLPSKNCKGVPYKRIKGVNIFNADIDKKVYAPLRKYIYSVRSAKNYAEIYRVLNNFMSKKTMIKLHWTTPKCKEWIDAYKGAGAYYTLKNLVMFHNCKIEIANKYDIGYGSSAIEYLKAALDEYKGEGWRMFALMKKVIADNGINTKTYIGEICNK